KNMGGTVLFPKGTYLLDSAYPSSHPWAFHNLIIDSNVTLIGETGAKLLQGPKGRHPLPKGAEGVRNTVLAFGADHEVIRFQNLKYNGGFYDLQGTQAESQAVIQREQSQIDPAQDESAGIQRKLVEVRRKLKLAEQNMALAENPEQF